MTDEYYYVRNWWKFQHYHNRRPPWIKLHRTIETDPAFQSLSEIDQYRLIKLWLCASDLDGRLPRRQGYVRATLGLGNLYQESSLLARLESSGLISKEDIRGCRRDLDSPSRDRGRDREENTIPPTPLSGGKAQKKPAPVFVLPDWIPVKEWEFFLEMRRRKRNLPTEHAKDLLVRKLSELKTAGNDPVAVLEQSTIKGWLGLFEIHENGNNGHQKSFDQLREERVLAGLHAAERQLEKQKLEKERESYDPSGVPRNIH